MKRFVISMGKSALFISDQHIMEGQDLRRFEALGKLIAARKPDYIINGGDQTEMSALYGISTKRSSWKYSEETAKRIEAELKHKDKANSRIFGPTKRLQSRAKKSKKKPYVPQKIFCMGNHDDRARLYWEFNVEDFKARHPHTTMEDWLGFNKEYDVVHPFQKPVVIEGVVFSHNFISGTAQASTVEGILKIASQSACGVHSHKAEFKASYTATGRPIFGLQGGWFFDPDEETMDWAGGSMGTSGWWNGVTYLHDMDGEGSFDPEFISTRRLLREYG